MPEAVKAVMAFCFERCGLEALTCSHFETNSQSKRVIENAAFSYVGNSEFFAKQLQKRFPKPELYRLAFRLDCSRQNNAEIT